MIPRLRNAVGAVLDIGTRAEDFALARQNGDAEFRTVTDRVKTRCQLGKDLGAVRIDRGIVDGHQRNVVFDDFGSDKLFAHLLSRSDSGINEDTLPLRAPRKGR